MKKYYILTLIFGIIIGTLFTCKKSEIPETKTTTKTEIKYVVTQKTDTIKIPQPKVIYKNSPINKNIDSTQYEYSYKNTIIKKENGYEIDYVINGWGNINNIDFTVKKTDSTKIITTTNTIEKTIIKPASGLYLSGEYITPTTLNNPTYKLNLDYVKNKVIIGTSAGFNTNTQQPEVGVKFGFKIN